MDAYLAGASDYILKNDDGANILSTIRMVYKNDFFLGPLLAKKLKESLTLARNREESLLFFINNYSRLTDAEKRITKQPLEYPSAGSTFKRPEGYFAGKLIMDAGLAGACVGGAQVSEKHCGFVINRKNATSADVAGLIQKVTETVQEKFGVTLAGDF